MEVCRPKKASGKTKVADGMIEISDVDPQVKAATLTWTVKKPKPPKKKAAATPPPKITTPTYPRPIDMGQFYDKPPDPPDPDDSTIEWTLKIGSLPTFDDITGVGGRLYNLGAACDPPYT